MQVIIEGRLTFSFPDNTVATKYDDWSFYRNQFNSAFNGTKAVDFLHVDDQITWLIEVKDYRANPRTKSVDIGDEIALKVRDTLAGLVASKFNATEAIEKDGAKKSLQRRQLRVVLHLEQPIKCSRLFPKPIDPSKVKQKLKQLLKSVDPHPMVVDQRTLSPSMNWTVTG